MTFNLLLVGALLFGLEYLVIVVVGNPYCTGQFKDETYKPHPDMKLSPEEVIRKYGYIVENHKVMTHDGYILTLFRITGSPRSPPRVNKPAVYLNHGLFGSGQVWFLQHGNKNLAFKLADEGFDVWIANGRGTSQSMLHRDYSEQDAEYWDFSFHEMGMNDVPRVIIHIKRDTGLEKIYYVGHSMGCTEFFVAMSERPELNKHIATAILYAPVAYINHATNFGRMFAPFADDINVLLQQAMGGKFDVLKFLEEDLLGEDIGELCSYSAWACGPCSEIDGFLFGDDPSQMNYTLLPLIFSKFPETVSSKTLTHYAQMMESGGFHRYDYGENENELKYGAKSPPHYDLSKINVPMVIWWADKDDLATPIDVRKTISQLRPGIVKENNRVDWDDWTHRDFLKAIDADKLVYDRTVEIFKKKLYG